MNRIEIRSREYPEWNAPLLLAQGIVTWIAFHNKIPVWMNET